MLFGYVAQVPSSKRTLTQSSARLTRTVVPKPDFGFASIVLGCLWTAAALALATQAGSARARSVQMLFVLACLVGTTGCAMLTFAFFPRFVQRLRILGWLTVIAASLLALEVVWSAWQLPPEDLQLFANPGDARDSSNLAAAASLIMLTCSISLITARLISNQASQHRFHPAGAVQAIFLMFWRQHKLVGWMALALSAAHSVYFLRYPRGPQEQWTGIVAFALLGLLGLIGLFTSYRRTAVLWVHRGTAALLAVVLTLHWPPVLYIEAGALIVLGVTALVNLKLAAFIVQHVLGSD
jgi:hypothetical protein